MKTQRVTWDEGQTWTWHIVRVEVRCKASNCRVRDLPTFASVGPWQEFGCMDVPCSVPKAWVCHYKPGTTRRHKKLTYSCRNKKGRHKTTTNLPRQQSEYRSCALIHHHDWLYPCTSWPVSVMIITAPAAFQSFSTQNVAESQYAWPVMPPPCRGLYRLHETYDVLRSCFVLLFPFDTKAEMALCYGLSGAFEHITSGQDTTITMCLKISSTLLQVTNRLLSWIPRPRPPVFGYKNVWM